MLDEQAARKPDFRDGTRLPLGDGQEWTFPRPWLRLYPVRGADGKLSVGGGPGYGNEYDDLVDELVDCDPDDTTRRLALQFRLAACLLQRNYNLTDRDLKRLLAVDLADSGCEARWARINQVLLGQAPKASADGSVTP
jgi:hypothetical protein